MTSLKPTGRELLDLVPDLAKHYFTVDAFLSSIAWRDPTAVSVTAVQLLSQMRESQSSKVIDTLITLATIPDHPLNAHFLDRELCKTAMADRDAWWSTGLHALWNERSAIDRLIRWCSRLWPHSNLDDEAAELTATTLAWLLTSSNRHMRDHATKALVRVVTWRPVLIDKLIQRFADLDDAYVAERVLAAAYGAIMRTTDAAGARVVAEAAHTAVFAGGRPRPHLLLRDYGRGIIKRAEYLLGPDAPSWQGVDPPYASDWPAIPDQAAIDASVPPWTSDSKAQPRSRGQYRIRSSVMDERFEQFDNDVQSMGRDADKAERIGKKYQWIAYHEMLAYMADHHQYTGGRGAKEIGTAYKGTWQDSFRDIDPSNVMQSFADSDEAPAGSPAFWVPAGVTDWSPGSAPKTWAKRTDDVPLPAQFLFSRDAPSQSDWVNLYTELKWTMPKPAYEASYKDGRREVWMHVEGALVKRSDVAALASKAIARQVARSGIHSSDNYTIYLGEAGWSEAARHFLDPYYGWL